MIARYVIRFCPERISPINGIPLITGILMTGAEWLTMDTEEPQSPDTANIKSTVPPVASILIAIAARISSVFKFKTKYYASTK